MISANAAMTGFYDYGEVARSVLIAIAASYAALDLAGRVTAASGRARLAWLSGGAIAMGIGIWAMHFKAMLAFRLPVSVKYHWPTVLLSLVIAILAAAFALYVASREKFGSVQALTGSVIMGGGIATLHYIDMAAMRLPAITRFSLLLVIQVQDSGEGLDPQQAEHIFEPFFTTKPEGIGMGLSISQSIVESHGGRLWAEAGVKGALFQFTLPAQ